VPVLVLSILKFLFLALLYLFIARAIRVIYLDLVGPRVPRSSAPASVPAPRKRRAQPRELLVTEQEGSPRSYPMSAEPLTIGRAESCQVILGDTYVSQMHARVYPKDGEWLVEDLGSTNGTYVNGQRIAEVTRLRKGDRVQFGNTVAEITR
jgi:pSer/pThr/pTyr-binding forkhead associated (FHA) protein